MSEKTVISQMQQFGGEWLKLVAESTNLALADAEKFEKQSIAQFASAVDAAGRVAKEAISTGEQFRAHWRETLNEYAQRTLDLVNAKN
jgi:hypothetical protein